MEDELIGKIFFHEEYGQFKVIKLSHKKKYHKYFEIEFERTGNKLIASRTNIIYARVRDNMHPSVHGVGYIGNLEKSTTSKDVNPFYERWYALLSRIYSESHSHYEYYGGKGVTIQPEWLCFKNFYEDVQKLEGFDLQKIINKELELDKDLKQSGVINKIYSKHTCIWLDKTENNMRQDSKQKKFNAVSPSGDIYESQNIRKFARDNDLSYNSVRNVLQKKIENTKGWSFYYL